MGAKSNIQWTDATWNIAVGCTKVDEDCKFCYMYRQSLGNKRYDPKVVRRTTTVFNLPLKYKETTSQCWEGRPLIFTSSLTDVFHPAIDSYRHEMWDIIRKCPHLIFQILTKRPERILEHLPSDWGSGWDNVWLGTSIGSQSSIDRLYALSHVPAKVRFLSLEPLHGPIDLSVPFTGLRMANKAYHWAIVGGESGNDKGPYKYRPCQLKWIEDIVCQCNAHEVPLFVKQLGTYIAKRYQVSDRHAGNIEEFPKHLRIRKFPKLIV